jgi:Flp pilus assembly protein TadD
LEFAGRAGRDVEEAVGQKVWSMSMSRRFYAPMKRQQTASPAISRLLAEGLGHHQAGRIAQAEELYRKILTMDARHADSLHLLGMIAFQAEQHDSAAERIRRAIVNLGNVLRVQKKYDAAVVQYTRALELRQDWAEIPGNLGTSLHALRRLDEAEGGHRRALELKPDYAQAHNNLGVVLELRGDFAGVRSALVCEPMEVQGERDRQGTASSVGGVA